MAGWVSITTYKEEIERILGGKGVRRMGIFGKSKATKETGTIRQTKVEDMRSADYDKQIANGKIIAAQDALYALTGSSYGSGRPPVGAKKEYEVAIRQLREAEGEYRAANIRWSRATSR